MVYKCNFFYKKNKPVFSNFFLDIPDGKITALCGHNGAGKTTLLKCMSGILPSETVVQNTWFVGTSGSLISHFSLEQNLKLIKHDMSAARRYMEDFGLTEFVKRPVKKLSTGQQILSSLIVALVSGREILLLDEILSPLDPVNQEKAIKILKESQKTVLITSHDLNTVCELSDKVIILKKGQIVYENDSSNITPEELKEKYKVLAC